MYPREYRKVSFFNPSALVDTFDSPDRRFFLQKDFFFKNFQHNYPEIHTDSGKWFIDSCGRIILNTTRTKDTFEILKLSQQIVLVSKSYRIYFVKDYEETKAWYKKSRKNRRHTFKYILESNLYLNPYCYHKRAEYSKWLIDQSKHKAISN